jgi:hypothetical protein
MSAPEWSAAIDRMLARIEDTVLRVKDGFPHWADPDTGQWTTTPDGDWTGGYWIGMLWLAAAATGDDRYRSLAASLAERLRARIDAETVFKSFPVYYGAALGAILHDAAGPRDIAARTAQSLARLYAPSLRLVPLGAQAEEGAHVGGTETSIDSLQAAPFLFWAAGVTGDGRLRDVATHHAETIIALHLRPDGSFIQSRGACSSRRSATWPPAGATGGSMPRCAAPTGGWPTCRPTEWRSGISTIPRSRTSSATRRPPRSQPPRSSSSVTWRRPGRRAPAIARRPRRRPGRSCSGI